MKDERILYFSPAEFLILLELAKGPACSLLSDGAELEDDALAESFTTLFQRGLIQRDGDGFALSGMGRLFDKIRIAPWAVYISDRTGNTALCYRMEDGLCLVELADVIVTTQYRLRQLDRADLEQWLFDSGLLEPPMLTDEDVREFEMLLEPPERSNVQLLLHLEKHVNGGAIDEVYEVCKYKSHWRIYRNNEDTYYTQETLSDMLTDCFGKEGHDHC